jgi:hypothetical protein
MERYMLMLLGDGTLEGTRVLGPVAAKAFRSPRTKFQSKAGNWDAGFVDTFMRGGFHAYGHKGGTLSFFPNMTLVPELRLGIFASTNTEGGDKLSESLAPRVIEHFYVPPPEPPLPGTLKPADALPYVGLDGFIQSLQSLRFAFADGYLITTVGGQVRRLLPADKPGIFKSDTGTGALVFELKNGLAQRFILPGLSAERAFFLQQSGTLVVFASFALVAPIAVLIGFVVRLGRGRPRTHLQGIAGTVQIASAVQFLIGAIGFAVLQVQAADVTNILHAWPVLSVLVGSVRCVLGGKYPCAGANRPHRSGLAWLERRRLVGMAKTALFRDNSYFRGLGSLAPPERGDCAVESAIRRFACSPAQTLILMLVLSLSGCASFAVFCPLGFTRMSNAAFRAAQDLLN